MYLTANIFDITTKNPIIYSYDTLSEAYKNYPSTGTRGVEVEYKAKGSWGYVNVNYTYYTAAGKVKVPQYEVPDVSGALLGLAQHRVNLNSSFNVYKKLFISPSASFMGKRYGYDYSDLDTAGTGMLMSFKSAALLNLFIGLEDLFGKGLNIGVGCYNILNEDYRFIQPYNMLHCHPQAESS
jgi:outer membrane cobalamin receptor